MKLGADKIFDALCAAHGIPPSVKEYKFHPTRKWRIDHYWPDFKLALEVQGGLFTGGRHSRGPALLREHEKLNHMAMAGIRCLFCTPKELETGEIFTTIKAAMT